MKKYLGSVLALYPTPLVIIGAMNGNKPTWMLAGHVGIIGHDRIMISMHKIHYTNQFIKETKHLSVALVDEELLPQADYVGMVSGKKVDKSNIFDYILSKNNIPVITDSPLVMECEVVDNYETETFDNFICRILNTCAEEKVVDENNKINYAELKPILFEMPTYSYLKTGELLGRGTSFGKDWQEKKNGE